MDIAWLIIAKRYVVNEDGTDSIIGILRGIRFQRRPYRRNITLIVRVVIEADDVGVKRPIQIRLDHEDGEHQFTTYAEAPSASLDSWLGSLPVMHVNMQCEFPKEGMYQFSVYVNDALKAQEWIRIIGEGG